MDGLSEEIRNIEEKLMNVNLGEVEERSDNLSQVMSTHIRKSSPTTKEKQYSLHQPGLMRKITLKSY
jgi:hypothetical protein